MATYARDLYALEYIIAICASAYIVDFSRPSDMGDRNQSLAGHCDWDSEGYIVRRYFGCADLAASPRRWISLFSGTNSLIP